MFFIGFSIFSSGRHFVQPSGASLVILFRTIGGILLCKYFEIRPLAKDEMLFVFVSSGSHLVHWSRSIAAILDFQSTQV